MTASVRLLLTGILLCGSGLGLFVLESHNARVTRDNTTIDKEDLPSGRQTAKQQKDVTSDREITRTIRRQIVQDKSLSTYGHNIKVFTHGGKVILLGLVRSEAESKNIKTKAVEVVGPENVSNQLEVVN
jgi:hyperosmotically inducible protein